MTAAATPTPTNAVARPRLAPPHPVGRSAVAADPADHLDRLAAHLGEFPAGETRSGGAPAGAMGTARQNGAPFVRP